MLAIDSIRNGIVLDHIQPGNGIKIFHKLGLDRVDYVVALISNASSKKQGRKDLIKIENTLDINFNMLGYLDSGVTVNIIEDEEVVDKINLTLPLELESVIKCKNPRCITSEEVNLIDKFYLTDRVDRKYRCSYCDQIYSEEG